MNYRLDKMYPGKRFVLLALLILRTPTVESLDSSNCPKNCICISEAKVIPASYCNGLKLASIPKNVAKNTEILSLRLNNIKNITKNDLAGLYNLRRLNLVFNDIEFIADNAFHDLHKLKSLNLGNNNIKNLSPNVFRNLISLEELFINNNLLTILPKDIFSFLPNLKQLSLQSNQIVDYSNEVFSSLSNLELLNLAHNKIDSISTQMFHSSNKLRTLYMDDNKIKTISLNAFDNLRELSDVYLDNNALTTINEELFLDKQSLNRLSVYNNPLRCDCNLHWIQDALMKGFPKFQHMEKTICQTPLILEGKSVSMIGKENFHCAGAWSSWLNWSECDKSCGGGVRKRKRLCNTNARSGDTGSCKGNEVVTDSCNTFQCSKGVLSNWSEWSACSTTCNEGIRQRERRCINPYTGSETSNCLKPLSELVSCKLQDCSVDGVWSSWGVWSSCSEPCGLGIKHRTRSCSNPPPRFGGQECDGGSLEKQRKICFEGLCSSKLHWSPWSGYSDCSASCGKGYKVRTRECLNEHNVSINILNACVGSKEEVTQCEADSPTCIQDGGWSDWMSWSDCAPISCKQYRSRTCTNPVPQNEGRNCTGAEREDKICDSKYCSLNTIWVQWQPWTDCSHSCGGGTRKRHRTCPGEQFKQVTCGQGKREEIEECIVRPCQNRTWSKWGEWSMCKLNGKQVRRRKCVGDGNAACDEGLGSHKERRECILLDIQREVVIVNRKRCRPRGTIQHGIETVKRIGNMLITEYTCDQYYKLKGNARMTCVEGKGWSSNSIPYCVPKCGKPVVKTHDHFSRRARLFGGEYTIPHSWPWQVAIEVKTLSEGWKLRCGGSLISNKWIVTAAHCLFDKTPTRLFKPSEIKVFLGVHDITKRYKSHTVEIKEAKFVKVHENFDHPTLNNDIGLIELDEEVKLKNEILPICLPSTRQKNLASVGTEGTVVGWGVTRSGNVSNELKELNLRVVSREDCQHAYQGNYNVTSQMICAGEHVFTGKPIDTCKGDSGGGFLFFDKQKKKWNLQGIVSWGSKQCGEPGKFSVYSRVTVFTNWIRKLLKERLLEDRK